MYLSSISRNTALKWIARLYIWLPLVYLVSAVLGRFAGDKEGFVFGIIFFFEFIPIFIIAYFIGKGVGQDKKSRVTFALILSGIIGLCGVIVIFGSLLTIAFGGISNFCGVRCNVFGLIQSLVHIVYLCLHGVAAWYLFKNHSL